jgi:hypothetical protein
MKNSVIAPEAFNDFSFKAARPDKNQYDSALANKLYRTGNHVKALNY